jgi:hypothetical protein
MWRFHLRALLQAVAYACLRRAFPPTKVMGVQVIDPNPRTSASYKAAIAAGLNVLARTDPIRSRRVSSQIRTIVNSPSPWGYSYCLPLRLCTLDACVCSLELTGFREEEHPDLSARFLASILVHEATLGHLVKRGVLPTRANLDRFDQVRQREAQRFMRRLGMARTPWDPERLLPLPSGTRWRLARGVVRRALIGNPKSSEQ